VIFIHGNGGGKADDYWFPYVKRNLEKAGIKVVARTFPDNDLAREKYWLPFLTKAIRNHQKWIVQFASSDDPYIPISHARYIHKQLQTEYYEYKDQKHFAPKAEFPEIVEVIKSKLK